MKRYDIARLIYDNSLVVNVQSDLIADVGLHVVIPLMPPQMAPQGHTRLIPTFEFNSKDYVLATTLIASVPNRELGEVMGTLIHERDRITAALDFLFQGF